MNPEARLRELVKQRSAIKGAITRHSNTLKKALLSPEELDPGPTHDVIRKIQDAKSRFDACNGEILSLSNQLEADRRPHTNLQAQVSQEVTELLSVTSQYINVSLSSNGAVRDLGTEQGSGDQKAEVQPSMPVSLSGMMSPGTKANLVSVKQSLIGLGLAVSPTTVDKKISTLKEKHEQETSELRDSVNQLRKELAALRGGGHVSSDGGAGALSRNHVISTPERREDRRVTFDMSEIQGWCGRDDVYSTYRDDMSPRASRPRDRASPSRRSRSSTQDDPGCREQDGGSVGGKSNYLRASDGGQTRSFRETWEGALLEQTYLQHQSMVSALRAPKITIPTFDGDPLEYATFINSFEDAVVATTDSNRSRLTSLISHCKGPAHRAIAGYANKPASEGYVAARKTLARKFGSPFIVSQAWLGKLLSYPAIKTAEQLDGFASDLGCARDSLQSLGHLGELQSTNTLRIIISKLPYHLRNKWRRVHRISLEEEQYNPLEKLISLIEEAAEEGNDPAFGEAVISKLRNTYELPGMQSTKPAGFGQSRTRGPFGRREAVNHMDECVDESESEELYDEDQVMHLGRQRVTCVICGSSQHFTSRCKKYREMNSGDRLAMVKNKGLCILCLSDGHRASTCPTGWKCQERGCPSKHHTSLHGAFSAPMESGDRQVIQCTSEKRDKPQSVNCTREGESVQYVDESCYMSVSAPTLPVTPVRISCGGKSLDTYALLDTGSTMTLCHERVATALDMPVLGKAKANVNTVTGRSTMWGHKVRFEVLGLGSESDGKVHPVFDATAVSNLPISLDHMTIASQVTEWKHLRDLNLHCEAHGSVELLVGQNNHHLLEPMVKAKGKGLYDPYAVLTPLGWTVYGNVNKSTEDYCCNTTGEVISEKLERDIQKFWEVEEVAKADKMSRDERRVYDLWERTWRVERGHIVLPVPFKEYPPGLPDNFYMALRALEALGRRLLKNPRELDQYRRAMAKNLTEDYSEEVTEFVYVNWEIIFYLLHHNVDHPRKIDETRVVMNGAAEFKGICLNGVVFTGPDLNNGLTGVYTKFRRYENATVSDIEGMFNQVWAPVEHRDCMRYLFWEDGDPTKPVKVYRMKTHVFGTCWAPAAAAFALKKTIELAPPTVSDRARVAVAEEFYVDDFMVSEEETAIAKQIVADVRAIVACGSFNLRKFMGNNREVLSSVDIQLRAAELAKIDLWSDRLPRGCTLGLGWDPEEDKVVFGSSCKQTPRTRRGMMSNVASVYDPLGFLAPFVLPAKLLLREACVAGTAWDCPLPDHLLEQWERWLADVGKLSEFKVDRWLGCRRALFNTLHVFGDACLQSYGAAAYLCTHTPEGEVEKSSLVMAKSKLAPQKTIEIPRLELCASVMAVKLAEEVKRILGVPLAKVWFWTDSMIVMYYIMCDPSTLQTFMANRVSFIQSRTEKSQWKHVPGTLNPADLVSRGVKIDLLVDNSLWLKGPDYIRGKVETWPEQKVAAREQVGDREFKKRKDVYLTIDEKGLRSEPKPTGILIYEEKCADANFGREVLGWFLAYSNSLLRMRRIVAALVGWMRIVRSKTLEADVCAEEVSLDEAETVLVRMNQKLYLKPEQLVTPAMKKLKPTVIDGVTRIGGRLELSGLPFDVKHPAIIPSEAPIAKQIVWEAHAVTLHGRVERTLHETRLKYWLIDGRTVVTSALRTCVTCQRTDASPEGQMMGPLPAERVDFQQPPFTNTGVDYFGPLEVVVHRKREKRYGALYTCLTTRCVHIEVAVDLSTSEFIETFLRFRTRRGPPRVLWSDNGTNFVGGKSSVAQCAEMMSSRETRRRLENNGVTWKFNTPGGSHQGGVWERMIRSVRRLLYIQLHGAAVSPDRLRTALCQVEQVLNSRPLTRLHDDPASLEPLTPARLLTRRSSPDPLPAVFNGENLRQNWRYAVEVADVFWERWLREYLPELQRRTRWLEPRRNLEVGELVMITADNIVRGKWPLGVVSAIHPGRDGYVRNVTVRTPDGYYRRPVTKVVRLEADTG